MRESLGAQDIAHKSYILAGRKAFFHRFCDSGFRTKWTGLWFGSTKLFDYFAFNVNGTWLSPQNCVGFEYADVLGEHAYRLDDLRVTEALYVMRTDRALVCTLRFGNEKDVERKLCIQLEVGVNIREREENWHDRKYEVQAQDDCVLVTSLKGSLAYGTDRKFVFAPTGLYRDHYPGELERCFIPGTFIVDVVLKPGSRQDVVFDFVAGGVGQEAALGFHTVKNYTDHRLEEMKNTESKTLENISIDTGFPEIDDLYRWSVLGLERLSFESDSGIGVFAGYPWFTQFWGRDSGWVIPAMVDYGNFEDAREALRTLAKFQSTEGEMPSTIHPDGRVLYGSADATPLWISALRQYVTCSGDVTFLKEEESNLMRAAEWCEGKDPERSGFLECEKRSTWMDSLDRDGKPVDVQAMWMNSIVDAKWLAGILGRKILSQYEMGGMRTKFEQVFWDEPSGLYCDRVRGDFKDGRRSVNTIFPLLVGCSKNPLKAIQTIETEEFTSEFGVRTLSNLDPMYSPSGYHTGSAWGWITGLTACVEFLNSRPEKGLGYLRILRRMLGKNCVGSLDEAWNSETGDQFLQKEHLFEPGGLFQAWSFATVIRCIDEHMLGISPDAVHNIVFISSSLPDGTRVIRRRRIGDDVVDFEIEREGKRFRTHYTSHAGKSYLMIRMPKAQTTHFDH